MEDGWVPQAVVFDCDGVLMDSESCWTTAEVELFARRGLTFTREHKERLIGTPMPTATANLARWFDEPGRELDIARELEDLVHEVIRTTADPMPGALDLVRRIQTVVPVAVASNSSRRILDAALERGGLSHVEVTMSLDDVDDPKPAPDMYLEACRRLGRQPDASLAFEDSPTGVASARAAGLRVIGVPTLADQRLDAHHEIASLTDARLLEWVDRWAPAEA